MLDLISASIVAVLGALVGAVVPRVLDARKAKGEQAYKFVYIKFYHLRRRGETAVPVYRRFVERLGEKVDVFDEFHMLKLNIFRGEQQKLVVGGKSTGIVETQILHPRQKVTFSEVEASKTGVVDQVIRRPSAVYFTRSIYLNGFQQGHEILEIKMERDTREARMIVDFSSIAGFRDIMRGHPSAEIQKGGDNEPLAVGETEAEGIYEVGTRLLRQGDVMKIAFRIDWDQPSLNDGEGRE